MAVTIARAQQEEKVDSLTIDGNTFSNVTIISRTDTHISFKHAHGFASVKLTALAPTEQTKVGYTPPPPPKTLRDRAEEYTAEYTTWLNTWLEDPRFKRLVADVRWEVDRILAENDEVLIYSAIGGMACVYILFCLGVVKICRKTTVRPGLWAWLPGFQFISLFKAAGMNPWSYLLLYIPPINLIVMITWCFKICRTRQKNPALGFLLLIPVINIFVFFYLAFSSQKNASAREQGPTRLKLSFQS